MVGRVSGSVQAVVIVLASSESNRGLQGSGSVTRTFSVWLVRGRMPLPSGKMKVGDIFGIRTGEQKPDSQSDGPPLS